LIPDNYTKLIRLYVPDHGFFPSKECFLLEGQIHYLRNVMRKNVGDSLRVFNGQDGEWLATLVQLNKNKASVKLDRKLLEQKTSSDIWVMASPVKKEAFDLMIEKSCELGAAKFIPVTCDRTVVYKINRERLHAIAVEAAEQSERLDIMAVEPLAPLKDRLNADSRKRELIFCLERAGVVPLAEIARKFAGQPLTLLVGPEGGFSSQEVDFINGCENVHPVSLGSRILRAETAVIAALSCLQIFSH